MWKYNFVRSGYLVCVCIYIYVRTWITAPSCTELSIYKSIFRQNLLKSALTRCIHTWYNQQSKVVLSFKHTNHMKTVGRSIFLEEDMLKTDELIQQSKKLFLHNFFLQVFQDSFRSSIQNSPSNAEKGIIKAKTWQYDRTSAQIM